MTNNEQDVLRDALLTIDDPYYLNTFKNAADEAEWWHVNEAFIQSDIQRFLPAGFDPKQPEVWRFIRISLGQFFLD